MKREGYLVGGRRKNIQILILLKKKRGVWWGYPTLICYYGWAGNLKNSVLPTFRLTE